MEFLNVECDQPNIIRMTESTLPEDMPHTRKSLQKLKPPVAGRL
jgi:hypothetical protein